MAFRAIYDRYAGLLYGVCVRKAGNDAAGRDLLQEVFVRAYRHLDRLRAPERLREWLCSIALNAARTQAASEVRWSRAQQDFAADARDVSGDDLAEPLLRELRIEAVREAIESVSDERQRLLLRRYYTDEREPTTREMAQELGLPASTVTVTLMRARARIARRVFTALAALEEARP